MAVTLNRIYTRGGDTGMTSLGRGEPLYRAVLAASRADAAKSSDLLHGDTIALRRGKKNWHVTIWR